VIALLLAGAVLAGQPTKPGILLLAHGGSPAWDDTVRALASSIDSQQPTEVAFGMASRHAIQAAVDRLVARGTTSIVAVPLFVSSHSSVVTSTEYLLGLRPEAPAALAAFAKMKHGGDDHAGHGQTEEDGTLPIRAPVPIRLTGAFNRDAVVSNILLTRVATISRTSATEAVVLVAHGPVPDDDNLAWLADMAVVAARMKEAVPFAKVDYLTVRDDAPAPIRDGATAELRELVARRIREGRRVLVAPLVVSYGGIEAGIRKRLDGLDYAITGQGLLPDDRLVGWVLEKARDSGTR
jgi:sirohydrochlorin ferrochelatase